MSVDRPEVSDVVTVYYKYNVNGEGYASLHEETFLSRASAVQYAESFGAGTNLRVRVNPDSPEVCVLDR
jgi:hypothetical protein